MSVELEPVYVAARRVLLDALEALAPHGDAIVVAGAQAVYLRTGSADIAVSPYTTDGDVVIDPSRLNDEPELERAMRAANFSLKMNDGGHAEPGVWLAHAMAAGEPIVVPVDLIVPQGASDGRGRRGARLGVHGRRAARHALGLEAALIDNDRIVIGALDPTDRRQLSARVAGPAALLVAKAHKLHDCAQDRRSDRLNDKDAADVVRLRQTTDPAEVAAVFVRLLAHPVAGEPTRLSVGYLDDLFGRRGREGIGLAARALQGALPPPRVTAICTTYVRALSAVLPTD